LYQQEETNAEDDDLDEKLADDLAELLEVT
jgi:hypothetical protein